MFRKYILAPLFVYAIWSILDYAIHGLILQNAYASTADLWRPMPEMKTGLMQLVTLVTAFCFAVIYTDMVSERNFRTGLRFGMLFGVAVGAGMGFGTFAVMPIPYDLGFMWFLSSVAQGALAGAFLGTLTRKEVAA